MAVLFPKGTITRVELHNFMTYEHIVQNPGNRINFILGRNGSGKSSIVCAVALCCGSSPSFIGRASTLADFIKHGKPTASMELTLANPGGEPIVIRRVIKRHGGNECYYNGARVPTETYLSQVKELNIMTDNLVQFLPQERVIDFSLMSPIQLLENTEKTIGNMNLSTMHDDLKAHGTNWEGEAEQIDRMRRNLNDAKDKEIQLKQEVEAAEVRGEMMTTLQLAALKKDRLALVGQQQKIRGSKDDLGKMTDELHLAVESILPFQQKLAKGKVSYSAATKALMGAQKEIDNLVKQYHPEPYASAPEALARENAQDRGQLAQAKKSHEDRQTKIQQQLTAKENLETQNNPAAVEVIKEKIASTQKDHKALVTEVERRSTQRFNLLAKRREFEEKVQARVTDLTRMQQAEDSVSQFLREYNVNIWRAYQWVEANRAQFRGKVFGPLFMEIQIKGKNQRHASIIESLIPRDLMHTFICEEEQDIDLLMNELIKKQNLRFPLKRMAPGARPSMLFVDGQQLRQLVKCQNLVSDLFQAPDAVTRYLNIRLRMANMPVFDEMTDELVERYKRVISGGRGGLSAPTMFAGNYMFKFRTTRFSDTVAASNGQVRPSRLLKETMILQREKPNTAPLEGEIRCLRAEIDTTKATEATLNQELMTTQGRFEEVSRQLQALRAELKDVEKIGTRINEVVREILRLQAIKFDYEEEAHKVAERIRGRNLRTLKELLTRNKQEVDGHRILSKTVTTTVAFVDNCKDVKQQNKVLKRNLTKLNVIWEQLRRAVLSHDRAVESLKANLNEHVQLIQNIPDSQQNQLSAHNLEQYKTLPAEIGALDTLCKAKRAQLSASGEINVNARRDLERHIAVMEHLEHQIATRNETIAKEKDQLATKRTTWLDTVQSLATQIGKSFSQFYKSMGLAGDVVLQRPDNPDRFDKYGYAIKVSYRPNRPLETLSGQVHSGGEKSVATALYMLAIQELTKCPFRVVDEINQGMDAENERRVFKMIVETASRCGGQYFILSPKLLPDLHLTKDVTVTVILSGTEMHSGSTLDPWKLSNIAAVAERLKRKSILPLRQKHLANGPAKQKRNVVEAELEDDDMVEVAPLKAGVRSQKKVARSPQKKTLTTVN